MLEIPDILRLRPMRRAFVSHSTADDGYIAAMESFLHAAGFDEVFNDVHPLRKLRRDKLCREA